MPNPTRRDVAKFAALAAATPKATKAAAAAPQLIHPGIWRTTLGTPEAITPIKQRHYPPAADALRTLPAAPAHPPREVSGQATPRGFRLSLSLAPNELVYGLGLQLKSFMQRGLKKTLRVNADPVMDSGDSHAPVPFYVTTEGYGVLIDTARYAVVYCGNKQPKRTAAERQSITPAQSNTEGVLPAAYNRFRTSEASEVIIELPNAGGADVYLFHGPTMREAVQRYNLFSGGGALPPRWGLGFWYRAYGQFDQDQVLKTAADLRASRIPCDVLGLEPGWQTHAYSCSFVWSDKFKQPGAMLSQLNADHYRVNLWEHAFTHPTSPLHQPLQKLSGDYEVWDGLVPDFTLPETRKLFSAFHEKEHVARGVAGYKLDECDNSDYTRNWSFPEFSRFPSGADGEQMHCLFGRTYQDAIQSVFDRRQQRTYGLVRSAHALAAPYPYVLYSDLYEHRDFLRGVVNSGFSGLLWCPEVRDAKNAEDLVRRLQTVVFSPLAMVNAWYIQNPPWKQVDRDANNAGRFAADAGTLEAECRRWIELRMRLIPYLYSAFRRYRREGIPPVRAMVLDFPNDKNTYTIDNQFMFGDNILVAPLLAGENASDVYLPAGVWHDFWTGQRITGGMRTIRNHVPLGHLPVFVRNGTILPLAEPTLHTADPRSRELTVQVYGDAPQPFRLYEDDDLRPASNSVNTLELRWTNGSGSAQRTGNAAIPAYNVTRWQHFA